MGERALLNRFRIDGNNVETTDSLHDCWLDYDIPKHWKEAAWAEDIDDRQRDRLERLLRTQGPTQYRHTKADKWRIRGTREWLDVAEAHRAEHRKHTIMTDAELAAESAAAIAALIAALQAQDPIAEAAARERMKAAEVETLTRQIAALQAKATPPPAPAPAKPQSRYDAFCDQCERCRHHWPCAFAKNSSLTCPGPKYRGFTFEAA